MRCVHRVIHQGLQLLVTEARKRLAVDEKLRRPGHVECLRTVDVLRNQGGYFGRSHVGAKALKIQAKFARLLLDARQGERFVMTCSPACTPCGHGRNAGLATCLPGLGRPPLRPNREQRFFPHHRSTRKIGATCSWRLPTGSARHYRTWSKTQEACSWRELIGQFFEDGSLSSGPRRYCALPLDK